MDSNRVKGTLDEIAGIAKQKTGEITGSTKLQVEGVAQQVKGKLETVLGNATDAVHDATEKAHDCNKPVVEFPSASTAVGGPIEADGIYT